jgi:hypothetical protein
MSLTIKAFVLTACFTLCANAQTRTLALYTNSARGLDPEAALFMRAELQRLLSPAGIEVAWKRLEDRKAGNTFDFVAVSTFQGSCTDDEAASTPAAASLADTSIANGHILPFFRIDCPSLIRMLGAPVESAVLGRALARLAAHEIYHIVAQTVEHSKTGVTKASFSIQDLTATPFELDASSLAHMQPPSVTQASENIPGSAGR